MLHEHIRLSTNDNNCDLVWSALRSSSVCLAVSHHAGARRRLVELERFRRGRHGKRSHGHG